MILKFKQGEAWRFIDNILDLDILPVKDGEYHADAKAVVKYSRYTYSGCIVSGVSSDLKH